MATAAVAVPAVWVKVFAAGAAGQRRARARGKASVDLSRDARKRWLTAFLDTQLVELSHNAFLSDSLALEGDDRAVVQVGVLLLNALD